MPTDHIIALLIAERDKLNQAIAALTDGAATKRRGRPPKNSTAVASPTPSVEPKKAKRVWTAAQKKAAGDRFRTMWAAKKAATAKPTKSKKA
jgi:hypothetical protein